MQCLGPDQVVASLVRDAAAPDQVGPRSPDVTEAEVGEAAIHQGRGQVRGLRRFPVQLGYRLVEHADGVCFPAGPHVDEAPLEQQHAPVLGRDQALGAVQQAQAVPGPAEFGLPLRHDAEQPGGQGVMRLVHLPRIRLSPVFGPPQVP